MVKKAVRQGRSERGAEAYFFWYVEAPSDARTQLAAFFNILNMGRTLATFTQLVWQEIESWRRYRRALRAEDQQALDLLFAAARKHSAAGAYLARETPFDVMVVSMLLEQQQQLLRLQQKVRDLETRALPQSPHGVAP